MRNPPGKKSKGMVKSRVVSARLNPEFPEERAALEIIDNLLEQDYSKRQIITNAILHASGYTPDMFHRERSDAAVVALEEGLMDLKGLSEKVDLIYEVIAHQVVDLLRNVRSADPEGFRSFANQPEDDSALDDLFVQNAKRAARKTYRQKHPQDSD